MNIMEKGDNHQQESTSSTEREDSISREAVGGHSASDLPQNYYRRIQFISCFLSVAFAYQAAFIGFVMMADVITIIDEDLGPSISIGWVILVFILTQTVTFTLNGRLSDIFGRRYFFLAGNTLGFIGFMVSGRAKSINMLIGGSVIAGFGTGIQQSNPVLFGEMVPNEQRYTVLGVTYALLTPLSAIAPGLARTFVSQATWRWVYYLPAILSAISGLLQLFFYFPPAFHHLHKGLSRRKAILNLDYGGVIILSGSLVSLLLGISWGGQKYPWKSADVIAPIVVGGSGLIGFVLWESYGPLKEPLMPLYLFKNRNYVALTVVSGVGVMIFYALNIVLPQQIAAVWGESVTTTGWISCTLVGGAVVGQLMAGFVIKLAGRYVSIKWQLVLCCVLFTTFTGAMAAVSAKHKGRAITFSILSSWMIGFMEVLTMAGAPLMVDPKDLGLANGIEFTTRGILSCLATSIYVTILQNKLALSLGKYVAPAVIAAGLPQASIPVLLQDIAAGNQAGIAEIPGITPAVLSAITTSSLKAFIKSYQTVYFVSLAFGGCAIIAALVVDEKKMEAVMTTDIARKLQDIRGTQPISDEKLTTQAEEA